MELWWIGNRAWIHAPYGRRTDGRGMVHHQLWRIFFRLLIHKINFVSFSTHKVTKSAIASASSSTKRFSHSQRRNARESGSSSRHCLNRKEMKSRITPLNSCPSFMRHRRRFRAFPGLIGIFLGGTEYSTATTLQILIIYLKKVMAPSSTSRGSIYFLEQEINCQGPQWVTYTRRDV